MGRKLNNTHQERGGQRSPRPSAVSADRQPRAEKDAQTRTREGMRSRTAPRTGAGTRHERDVVPQRRSKVTGTRSDAAPKHGEQKKTQRGAPPRTDAGIRQERGAAPQRRGKATDMRSGTASRYGEQQKTQRSTAPRIDAGIRQERGAAPQRRGKATDMRSGTASRYGEQQKTQRGTATRTSAGARQELNAVQQREKGEKEVRSAAAPKRRGKDASVRSKAASKRGGQKAVHSEDSAIVRLNKFLADAGVCSRRKADELIREGVVKVNKEYITEPGTQVHLSDLVTVHGEPVNAEKHLTYILLNKPKGYITTTQDEKGRKTVMDIVRSRARVFPVGRLDRNTTGVLLFTNDGDMANKLMHPRYQVPRVYNATLDKPLPMEHARKIANGIELEDGMASPCSIVIDPQKKNKVMLEITEGRNREVRRIFEALGYDVEKLDRKMYANMTTRGMKRGEFRHLTRQEVQELEELLGLQRRTTSTGQAGTRRRSSGVRNARKKK